MQITVGHAEHPLRLSFTRERGFPLWTAGCLVRGTVRTTCGSGELIGKGPSVALIRPDVSYSSRYAGKSGAWTEYWAFFTPRPEWHRWLDWPEVMPGFMHLPLAPLAARSEITAAFKAVYNAARCGLPEQEAFAMNALEKFLLLCNAYNPRTPGGGMDARVRTVIDVMLSDPAAAYTVEQLAASVHLSASHLAHLFRAQTGESPIHFLERQRLRRAQELLLSTDLPIRQIASQAGFENPYHFSTRFRKRIGQSPREYRRHPA